MTDDTVVAAAKRGDQDAWRTLYRAHAGRLVVWLGTRSGTDSAVAAEDVAAQTWLTAAEKVADYEGGAEEFGGVAVRHRAAGRGQLAAAQRPAQDRPCCGDARARGRRPGHLDPVTRPGSATSWPASALASVTWSPASTWSGLSTADTARALGISQVAVRVARHRALRRLRAEARTAMLAATIA